MIGVILLKRNEFNDIFIASMYHYPNIFIKSEYYQYVVIANF